MPARLLLTCKHRGTAEPLGPRIHAASNSASRSDLQGRESSSFPHIQGGRERPQPEEERDTAASPRCPGARWA